MEATSCSSSEATAFLQSNNWDLSEAVDDFLSSRTYTQTKRSRTGGHFLDPLTTLFNKYKAMDEEDDDIIGLNGTIQYFKDMNVDLEDPTVLCINHLIDAKAVGAISREGFINGWSSHSIGDLSHMKKVGDTLHDKLLVNTEYYTTIYEFTFTLIAEQLKAITVELAGDYWTLLLPLHPKLANSPLVSKWIMFTKDAENGIDTVSKDTWNMVLPFLVESTESDPTLTNYDEMAAWPCMIDIFVESVAT